MREAHRFAHSRSHMEAGSRRQGVARAPAFHGCRVGSSHARTHIMKWETPQAIDQRFGFEITMYIANR